MLQKVIQYAYLFLAVFFIYETVRLWNLERERAYLLLFFAAMAVGMFFFKKYFRNKMNQQ